MTREATTFQFDAARLLAPISPGAPAGDALRYEGTYDAIAALRREDDPTLDPGVWTTDLKKADWQRVAQTCLATIETRSKDVQVASWLLEAWIRLHGFAGLREGLRAITSLCEAFWDGLYPEIQDGDLDFRLAPFFWIDDKLSVQIRLLPITAPDTDEIAAYTLADWEMACRNRMHPVAGNSAAPTLAKFEESSALTPLAWRVVLVDGVRGSLEALEALREQLNARCGAQGPALGNMRNALEAILALNQTSGDAALSEALNMEKVDAGLPIVESPVAAGPAGSHAIRTRAEAFQRLAEVAEYLERTEPHSPVPRLVRRAIAWGGMNLADLLADLVRDKGQLADIYRLLEVDSARK
jgi:type VI secretion system protein ImpA